MLKMKSKKKVVKKEGLLSKNTEIVKLSDVVNNGCNLSTEFHVNRLKCKYPYILKDGLYEIAAGKNKDVEYLTTRQAFEINNLLNAKKYIDLEIINIKKPKK